MGGVSDADFVHHHKPWWLRNAASGSETTPTDFVCKAGSYVPAARGLAFFENLNSIRPAGRRRSHATGTEAIRALSSSRAETLLELAKAHLADTADMADMANS